MCSDDQFFGFPGVTFPLAASLLWSLLSENTHTVPDTVRSTLYTLIYYSLDVDTGKISSFY